MKRILAFLFATLALTLSWTPLANADELGFAGKEFQKVVYFEHGGKGGQSGRDAGNALPFSDADLVSIPANTIITNVYVIVDTAVSGVTAMVVGDDDDADGFVENASVTLGTPGLYSWSALQSGTYLRGEDSGGAYAFPNAKLYSASGKEVKVDFTTASSAGALRVVIEGYRLK